MAVAVRKCPNHRSSCSSGTRGAAGFQYRVSGERKAIERLGRRVDQIGIMDQASPNLLPAVEMTKGEEKVGPNGKTLRRIIGGPYHCENQGTGGLLPAEICRFVRDRRSPPWYRALLVVSVLTAPAVLRGQDSSAVRRQPHVWLRVDRRRGTTYYIDRLRTTLADSTHADAWFRLDMLADSAVMVKRTPIDKVVTRYAIDCLRIEGDLVELEFYHRGEFVEHYVIPLKL